jgi:hypothetical protein
VASRTAALDDRSRGHSIEWDANAAEMLNDRAAVRAQEEYAKAVIAFQQAHSVTRRTIWPRWPTTSATSASTGIHHGDYESWAASRTDTFAESAS